MFTNPSMRMNSLKKLPSMSTMYGDSAKQKCTRTGTIAMHGSWHHCSQLWLGVIPGREMKETGGEGQEERGKQREKVRTREWEMVGLMLSYQGFS